MWIGQCKAIGKLGEGLDSKIPAGVILGVFFGEGSLLHNSWPWWGKQILKAKTMLSTQKEGVGHPHHPPLTNEDIE